MFNFFKCLNEDGFIFVENSVSKKLLFQSITNKASLLFGANEDKIFSVLNKREKLGSTSIGNGIAIPYVEDDSIDEPKCLVTILSNGIDYDSTDQMPVDLIFLLLMPKSNKFNHLQILASLSRLSRNSDLINKLRGCQNSDSAFAIFSQFLEDQAA